jgi:hypothetical protein
MVPYPVQRATVVPSNQFFTKVTVGRHHACGLTVNGEVYCWGSNRDGELGTPHIAVETRQAVLATSPFPDEKWVDVEAGIYQTCGIVESGRYACTVPGGGGAWQIGALRADYMTVWGFTPGKPWYQNCLKTPFDEDLGLAGGDVYCGPNLLDPLYRRVPR